MRIESPVGEYEYRVTGVRFQDGGLAIAGSLGQWETTMVIGPDDLARWGRRAGPPLAVLSLISYTCLKLWKRVS
jgi:hypothetical protein